MKALRKFSLGLIFLAVFSLILFFVARAEDDDDEKDEDERQETTAPAPSSSSGSSSTKTVTKTIILEPAKIVTSTVMQDVQVADSDKDGIADETDPHLNIPEQLIVSDTNFDGIDDSYELSMP